MHGGRASVHTPAWQTYHVRPVHAHRGQAPGGLDSPVLSWDMERQPESRRAALAGDASQGSALACLELAALLAVWLILALVGLWTVVSAVVEAVVG